MANLTLSALSKHYGSFTAVKQMNLDVREGEFLVLLGPSGCGKTTTLRMIAGFIEPSSGTILIGGNDVTALPPYKRNLGIVFQNYAIFPHLSVFENVAYGLRRRKLPSTVIEERAHASLRRVRLDHLADRMPKQLSGGQQQRVAIARALAIEPDILLLDEPLSNLDAKLRHQVREEIKTLQTDLGITTVMVTHDQEEALSLGDRLVVMQNGEVQQIGSGRELYESPANIFVADFIGRTNVLEGSQVGGQGHLFRTRSGLELICRNAVGSHGAVVVRPEMIKLDRSGEGATARIASVSYLGPVCEVSLQLGNEQTLLANVSSDQVKALALAAGQNISISVPAEAAYAI